MAVSTEHYEKALQIILEPLCSGRELRYSGERSSQPDEPYATILPLPSNKSGLPYRKHTDRAKPDLDMDEQVIRPVQLTVSVKFIGGNARGQLDMMLTGLEKTNTIWLLESEGLGYLFDTGPLDISESVGDEAEQRAITNITFSANILTDKEIIPSIQEVSIVGEHRNVADELVVSTNITVKEG